MKVLIHSNGPHVSTGYGVQTAQLAERLRDDEHDVAISCTYGQQGATGKWRGITLYPTGYEVNGNDVIHLHAAHHFGGDEKAGWLVTLLDVWCLVNPLLAEFNVAAWTPVDHFPVPQDVLAFFHRTGAVPVAMSRFGERLLTEAGLSAAYVPLSVDTSAYKPTPELTVDGHTVTARELFKLPEDAYVVGMVAMNKGWSRDRKGFNEALRAFAAFWKEHNNAVLLMHSEKYGGADGFNLVELAQHAAVPEHALVWTDQYAYQLGLPANMMAAAYTAMDVLLAPSHGEGFGVPLVEAQACGTPVICTDFSSQTELVGPGWLVAGQPEWDAAQHASYVCPYIVDVLRALNEAYALTDDERAAKSAECIDFAAQYDSDLVYDTYWRPLLAQLDAPAETLPLERERMTDVDVIVPLMRAENVDRIVSSYVDTTPLNSGRLVFVIDEGDWSVFDKYIGTTVPLIVATTHSDEPTTYAEKMNRGLTHSRASFVFLAADDVEFRAGWLTAARELSDRFDVIGTNDSSNGVKNPEVANGTHADHFFVRRSYIDEYGACLDGPSVLAPDVYRHWYTDKEIVQLARARGVFAPCLTSVVEHHHPGYDGREDLRAADPVYMAAVDASETDRRTFMSRLPLIEMQRTSRRK